MPLNEDMQDLINKIKWPSVFYLPKDLVESLVNEDLEILERIGLLNTLLFINKNGKTKRLENSIELLVLVDKNKILKTNVFELLEFETRLNNKAFDYLLDNYFNELSSWLNLSKLVKDEARHSKVNYKLDMQFYIDIQYECLIEHYEEIKQKFGSHDNKFKFDRIINSFKKEYSINSKFKPKKLSKKQQVKEAQEINDFVQSIFIKKPLLTDKEADSFLLSTVFNLE